MRSRAWLLRLALLPLVLLIGCFGVSIDASAELQINQLSSFTTQSFYGDTISANYTLGGVPYSTDLQFVAAISHNQPEIGQVPISWGGVNIDPDCFLYNTYRDYDLIVYQAVLSSDVILNDVEVFGLDTYYEEYARGAIMCGVSGADSDPVQNWNSISLYPDNYFDNLRAVSANSSASANLADYYGYMTVSWNYDISIPFRVIPYEFTEGGSIGTVHFDSVRTTRYGQFLVAVLCPYVGGSMSNTPPVTATTTASTASDSTSTNINVNVDVDMTETNGILGSIRDLISNLGSFIVNGLKDLFLPDSDDITNWKQTIVTILNETFGGIPELENQLKDAISSIFTATARQTVTFKGIKVPAAAGQPEAVIVPEQEVALRPPGFDNLFSWAETFINIVATIAVANTCFNQIKRIVVGEVVIDAD